MSKNNAVSLGEVTFTMEISLLSEPILPSTMQFEAIPLAPLEPMPVPPIQTEAAPATVQPEVRVVKVIGRIGAERLKQMIEQKRLVLESKSSHSSALELLAVKKKFFETGGQQLPEGATQFVDQDGTLTITLTDGRTIVVKEVGSVLARARLECWQEQAEYERRQDILRANRVNAEERLRLDFLSDMLPPGAKVETQGDRVTVMFGSTKSTFVDRRLTERLAREAMERRSQKARESGIKAGATVILPTTAERVVHVPVRIEDLTCQMRPQTPKNKGKKGDEKAAKSGRGGKKQ